MRPKIGSLFAGYGGIDLALEELFGAEPAWFSEFDAAPSKILAHHWPTVPNHGDITAIDWATVAPVDIITGGSPCQDMSNAGKRAGMKAGTRSGLWSYMLDAITVLRPGLVVWENVRGALSAEADSELEPCSGCVGGDDDGPVLRALGRVLGDLAGIGYDAAWTGLRAADVGAPHGRFRVFVLAWPAADTDRLGHEWAGDARDGGARPEDGDPSSADAAGIGLEAGRRDLGSSEEIPRVDGGIGSLPDRLTLLPTPRATDGTKGGPNQRGSSGDLMMPSAVMTNFGQYAAAVERWEAVTRPAPSPTEPTGKGGAERLSPRFVEWMQGLPEGHVTDPAIGISRNDELKALGNGVCPQQCIAAIRHLLTIRDAALAQNRAAA